MTTHAVTRPPLDPAPADPDFVDWVIVGRLLGVLPGPVHRRLTPAEFEHANARGMTLTQISKRMELSTTQVRRMVTRQPDGAVA